MTPNGGVAGPNAYQILMMWTQCVGPHVLLVGWCCGPCAVDPARLGGEPN